MSIRFLIKRNTDFRHNLLKNFLAFFLFIFVTGVLAESFNLSDRILAMVEQEYGEFARRRVAYWRDMMNTQENHVLAEKEKLKIVNSFFNELNFVNDIDHWGKKDYWATPLEMLKTNGGDCEDFSIAKYFTLRALGVAEEKMRLTYVKALEYNQAHMVLAYYPYPNAEPLVLDNINPEILPASQRKDLYPVYSFNGQGLWLAKERGAGKRVGSADRLSLWKDLLAKMQREKAK